MSTTEQPVTDQSSAPEAADASHHSAIRRALITTGVVSAVLSFSASVLFFHFFPQTQEVTHPIAVVDVVKMGAEITRMVGTGGDAELAIAQAGERLQQFRAAGYIVLDARYVVTTPDMYVIKMSELIPGANDLPITSGGYNPPNLLMGMPQLPANAAEAGTTGGAQ